MKNTKKSLRLAFIGGGLNSAVGYVHFIASQLDNEFKVVAGAFCRNPEENIRTAEHWGIDKEKVYTEWRNMVTNEINNIDAIVILTPTPDHLIVLNYLLERNIPAICEKAIVTGPKQIDQLIKFYDKRKHFIAVTFNYTGYPLIRELREMIADGQLGNILKIHLEMPQEGFRRPPDIAGKPSPPQAWRLRDDEIPTVCLDLGVHLHHIAHYLCQKEAINVIADFRNHSHYQDIIDDVNIIIDYEDNINGHMWFSKTAIGHRNGMKIRIFGDKGSAEWNQINPDELVFNSSNGIRQIIDRGCQGKVLNDFRYNRMKAGHPAGFIEAFANIYADFATYLRRYLSGERDVCREYAPEIAFKGLDFFSAAKKSYLEAKRISL